ncbi:MAG: cupin domain-containing protein [bacterium]|nr:cupin domain-containing protein [bacterium]
MSKLLYDDRPWGSWEILFEASYCKVKKIIVKSGHRLSYQKHSRREELWTIVKGTGTITLDGEIKNYHEGDVIHIPKDTAHRMENKADSDMVFIEIQRGSCFGEDDIVRLEDDYGRA